MKYLSLKSIAIILFVIFSLILSDKFIFRGRINSLLISLIEKPFSQFSNRLYSLRIFTTRLKEFGYLAEKNQELEIQRQQWLSALAQIESLEKENEFLKKSLNINKDPDTEVFEGSIFLVSRLPNGYDVLLNTGTKQGIAVGDVVITPEKVLVGQVKEVFSAYARVKIVSDPGFETTGRVIGSQTAGLVKGKFEQGLVFDLIAQGDQIKEGDIVVTNGNDLFPAALVIGKVEYIQVPEGTLFKSVRIKPAMNQFNLSHVLIIHKK